MLTDEGVLPNYAFPEPGVRLESVVGERLKGGKRQYETKEYIRPASSAIRELAPLNTFYADGRKVRIDEVDIGSKARPLVEFWRLCPGCSHTSLEIEGAALTTECPRCGDIAWSDAGQVRQMVHFRRSRSLATRLESSTVDDTEDREEAYYDTLDLIDVGPEHWNGAKLIEDMPFGYELLKGLTLRELNVGQAGHADQDGFKICGHPVGARGFEVCLECGRVRDGQAEIHHAAFCRGRKAGYSAESGHLFLYREIESEAIRILLPVSEIELERKLASFKAALQLGISAALSGRPRSPADQVDSGTGQRRVRQSSVSRRVRCGPRGAPATCRTCGKRTIFSLFWREHSKRCRPVRAKESRTATGATGASMRIRRNATSRSFPAVKLRRR